MPVTSVENLLSVADQISDEFQNGTDVSQTLKSKFDAEWKNRQALELTCESLNEENERLKNLRFEFVNNLTIQLQQLGDSHGLREDLKRLTDEWIRKVEEHRREIQSIQRNCDEKIRALEGQIRAISAEQQEKELSKKVRDLEKELVATRTRMAEQHGSSSSLDKQQLDAMKEELFKLRRENERLRYMLTHRVESHQGHAVS